MDRKQAIDFLKNKPVEYAKMLGFDKLGSLHNEWIREMLLGTGDMTLQAHRGSYKTTCDAIALSLQIILLPRLRTLFLRKTDNDVKEIIRQVQKIISDPHTIYFIRCIYGINLRMQTQSMTEINTNLSADIRGASQLLGMGLGGSLTGKHFDRIFTDDIVNIKDRVSRAERERTKLAYQELQNIKNRGGRIINTGTPWHKDDCFSIMTAPQKYDCYSSGIMTEEEIAQLKNQMSPSLFAANYELRHIASEDVIFTAPKLGAGKETIFGGLAHVDSAFYGEDYTAFSIMAYHDGKFYLFGKLWRENVQDCYGRIKALYDDNQCRKLMNETNADKGMVARDLRQMGMVVGTYSESMNKYIKIVTYLRAIWDDIVFVDGTDREYIDQICDYNENAEHDDAPDSAASAVRRVWQKKDSTYIPIW